ncbi:hypothetical protein RJT34_31923 [Clitoria ternatea]|uniref:Uncharacterized protein n=1 Tax=Clitoria ternatea TaxID=43366 RepID=A0AAN9EXA1_CLITE
MQNHKHLKPPQQTNDSTRSSISKKPGMSISKDFSSGCEGSNRVSELNSNSLIVMNNLSFMSSLESWVEGRIHQNSSHWKVRTSGARIRPLDWRKWSRIRLIAG